MAWVPPSLVDAVVAVCVDVSRETATADLRITHSAGETIGRVLDGTVLFKDGPSTNDREAAFDSLGCEDHQPDPMVGGGAGGSTEDEVAELFPSPDGAFFSSPCSNPSAGPAASLRSPSPSPAARGTDEVEVMMVLTSEDEEETEERCDRSPLASAAVGHMLGSPASPRASLNQPETCGDQTPCEDDSVLPSPSMWRTKLAGSAPTSPSDAGPAAASVSYDDLSASQSTADLSQRDDFAVDDTIVLSDDSSQEQPFARTPAHDDSVIIISSTPSRSDGKRRRVDSQERCESRRQSLPWQFSPHPDAGAAAAPTPSANAHRSSERPPRYSAAVVDSDDDDYEDLLISADTVSEVARSPLGAASVVQTSRSTPLPTSVSRVDSDRDTDDDGEDLMPFYMPPSTAVLRRTASEPSSTTAVSAARGWQPTLANNGKKRAATGTASSKSISALQDKEDRRQEREAAKTLKAAEKARDKVEARAVRQASARKSPQSRLEDLIVTATAAVHAALVASTQLAMLEGAKVTVRVAAIDGASLPVEQVRFHRKIHRTAYEQIGTFDVEDLTHGLVLVTATNFVTMIAEDCLLGTMASIRQTFPAHYSLTVVIEGLQDFFRKQAAKENAAYRQRVMGAQGSQESQGAKRKERGRDVSGVNRMRVESALVTVQMNSGMGIRLSSSTKETGLLVYLFTKAVATNVDRGERSVFLNFCPVVKRTEKVDRDDFSGLKNVWAKQLEQFHMLSESKAKAIATVYRSPRALMRVFDEKGKQALENIMVSQGETSRRIGARTSEKLYSFFTATTGGALVE